MTLVDKKTTGTCGWDNQKPIDHELRYGNKDVVLNWVGAIYVTRNSLWKSIIVAPYVCLWHPAGGCVRTIKVSLSFPCLENMIQ